MLLLVGPATCSCTPLTHGNLAAAASSKWRTGQVKLQVIYHRKAQDHSCLTGYSPSAQLGGDFDRLSENFIGSARREPDQWEGVELKLVSGTGASDARRKDGGKKTNKQAPRPTPVNRDLPPQEQRLTVQATSRGRAGKTVTIISGLQLRPESLQTLAKRLKTLLGTGGAVKDSTIEIQGNHAAKLAEELNKMGYKATKSGK